MFSSMDLLDLGLPLWSCPLCGTPYTAAARVVIEKGEHEELAHLTCLSCKKAFVLSVERSPARLRSVGLMTDCSALDFQHFHKAHRVTLDDVLRVHEGLRK